MANSAIPQDELHTIQGFIKFMENQGNDLNKRYATVDSTYVALTPFDEEIVKNFMTNNDGLYCLKNGIPNNKIQMETSSSELIKGSDQMWYTEDVIETHIKNMLELFKNSPTLSSLYYPKEDATKVNPPSESTPPAVSAKPSTKSREEARSGHNSSKSMAAQNKPRPGTPAPNNMILPGVKVRSRTTLLKTIEEDKGVESFDFEQSASPTSDKPPLKSGQSSLSSKSSLLNTVNQDECHPLDHGNVLLAQELRPEQSESMNGRGDCD